MKEKKKVVVEEEEEEEGVRRYINNKRTVQFPPLTTVQAPDSRPLCHGCPDSLATLRKRLPGQMTEVKSQMCAGGTGPLYLETVGVDNLVAYGTLHQHEVELIVFLLQCVLLSGLFTHHTHSRVRQNRLRGQINNALSGGVEGGGGVLNQGYR